VVGFDDAGAVSMKATKTVGETHSNALESFWGMLPTASILVRPGGCPIGGGGVVLPGSAASKGSGAGILSQKANTGSETLK
jgi:hypothetical protein